MFPSVESLLSSDGNSSVHKDTAISRNESAELSWLQYIRRKTRKMGDREERPGLHKLGSLVLAVALVPAMVSFATEYWLLGDSEIRHVGLWKVCGDTSCQSLHTDYTAEWFNAVRGLSVMALCLHLMSVATACCCGCLENQDPDVFSFIRRLEEVAAILAAALMTASLAVFAQSSHYHAVFRNFTFDWSFWLSLTALCCLYIGGGLVAVSRGDCGRRKRRGRGYREQILVAHDHQKKSIIYRDLSHPTQNFPEKNVNLSGGNVQNVLHKNVLKNNFMEKLKSPDMVQSFSSLEGIPRVLHKLTGTSKAAKDMSDTLVDDV